jgi:predicted ribonuclease YlaK
MVRKPKKGFPLFENNVFASDDEEIIASAVALQREGNEVLFLTNDLLCGLLAKRTGLTVSNCEYAKEEIPENTGYKYINAEDYEKIYDFDAGELNDFLRLNEYLLVKQDDEVVDAYKRLECGLEKVPYHIFNSDQFGEIKPKDFYQRIAMDSLATNQITMLRGPAGSGKSFLALGYLFQQLEKKKIDRIIIFCNTVATMGSAKLGYYPGTRDEKLLDSQIGNFLSSKIGDPIAVRRYIDEGRLVLLPLSDIRGYDTGGMQAGVYITEAQNLDIELMRLALQRIGEDSICILDGDSDAQVDLEMYAGSNNGMRRVSEIFCGADFYGEVKLQTIQRSKIAALAQKL